MQNIHEAWTSRLYPAPPLSGAGRGSLGKSQGFCHRPAGTGHPSALLAGTREGAELPPPEEAGCLSPTGRSQAEHPKMPIKTKGIRSKS